MIVIFQLRSYSFSQDRKRLARIVYSAFHDRILYRLHFWSVFQWIGAKQEEFNMSSMQILYYQAPFSFILLLILIPAYETYSSQLELLKNFSNIQMIVFVFSGVAAFTVNLTTYWIIKNTSG